MIIGVPREILDSESRVALDPGSVKTLTKEGHRVLVEQTAGKQSGFSDDAYAGAGAEIITSAEGVYSAADLVVKVKQPLPPEFPLLRPSSTLFAFLHLAAEKALTEILIQKKITAIAYETVRDRDGHYPILAAMSQIAGRLSVQIGAHYLEKTNGGKGLLLGGADGVPSGRVVVLGTGTVGMWAARVASGIGARVTLLAKDRENADVIRSRFSDNVSVDVADPAAVAKAVRAADLLIGAVSVPAARTPILVSRVLVSEMEERSVIVDVAVDQGGCIETTRPTTHSKPVYVEEGVVHYAVPNIPALVPRTSTFALTHATVPHLAMLADQGPARALAGNPGLMEGLMTENGRLRSKAVAKALGLPFER